VRVSAAEDGRNRTTNVIAQMPGGDRAQTVMVGAHLDSVPEGPGINDNGSGSATVLELALQLAELDAEPRARVRFAFWGAEEIGLLGSRHYVEGLKAGEIEDISAYLNFDMIGSPNFTNTIYEGPDEVEDVFGSYFEARDIEAETNAALDGRSDHGPFQDENVPTGGLFSGAEGAKSEEQREAFGGRAGDPFDPCYHRPCDDIDNLSRESLDTLSDAAAHATAVLAGRKEP
jgi:aminopeptidase S